MSRLYKRKEEKKRIKALLKKHYNSLAGLTVFWSLFALLQIISHYKMAGLTKESGSSMISAVAMIGMLLLLPFLADSLYKSLQICREGGIDSTWRPVWVKGLPEYCALLGLTLTHVIFTFLWSCLLIIPGIIKSYGYSQAFYIFMEGRAQGTKVTFRQALKQSNQLMKGHKWTYFKIQFSFVGYTFLLSSFASLPIFISSFFAEAASGFRLLICLIFGILFIIGFSILALYQAFVFASFYQYLTEKTEVKTDE